MVDYGHCLIVKDTSIHGIIELIGVAVLKVENTRIQCLWYWPMFGTLSNTLWRLIIYCGKCLDIYLYKANITSSDGFTRTHEGNDC